MTKPFITGACAVLLACVAGAAHAAVTLPSGDFFQDGTLEFLYGDNGSARIDPALYVDSNELFGPGALGEVYAPPTGAEFATGLAFDYSFSGIGTDTMTVVYGITNQTGLTWTGLRFLADVSGNPFDGLLELASVHGAPLTAADPAAWGIDDFDTGNLYITDILGAGQLDNSDGCGGVACAAEGALQWNLDQLADGQRWVVTVQLSEAGLVGSQRWLEFALDDGGPTGDVLSFSGQAVVVPLPAAAWLLLGGVPLLAARRRAAGAERAVQPRGQSATPSRHSTPRAR